MPQMSCPLYPRKRTCAVQWRMSALGQKGTWPRLFDHLIRACEQHRWHGEIKHFRSRKIDDQIQFGRLYNWQVSRLLALEDATSIYTDLTKHISDVGAITHQPAHLGVVT